MKANELLGMIAEIFGVTLEEQSEETQKVGSSTESKVGESNESDDDKKKKEDESSDKDETPAEENKEAEKKKVSDTDEKEEVTMVFEEGWFDSETGKVDFSKIKNKEALAAIKTLTDKMELDNNARILSDAITEELKNYSLNISDSSLRKMLNTSNVKIGEDGKVTGAKEAIEELKKNEPGLFKNVEDESNPLNEGFNPVQRQNTTQINSFEQAFKLMEEV